MDLRLPPGRARVRSRRPSLESLEPRELLATVVPYPSGAIPPVGGLNGAPAFAGPVTPSENLGPLKPDPSLVESVFAPTAYPATINGVPNPQPNAGELAREYFTAEFTGTYTITPGHFAGQAETIKFVSRALRSNQFLHGKAQVVLFPASDSSGHLNTAAPFFGTAALIPQNLLDSGNTVVLDLEGNPSSAPGPVKATYNAQGLPTHVVWQPDTASGSGYTGATGFNQGYGYMDAVYTPDHTPKAGTTGSGKVTVLFQGLYNSAGILSDNDPGTQ
jgi:hypothetical protein